MAWFLRLAGSVYQLRVLGGGQRLPASLLGAVLVSQAALLRELHLDCGAFALDGADFGVLVSLTRLESLTISPASGSWPDRGSSLFISVSRLPALEKLRCFVDWPPMDGVLPTPEDLPALQSTSLTEMCYSIASTHLGTLTLGTLPRLASCEFRWVRGYDYVIGDDRLALTSASFGEYPCLTQLSLSGHRGLHLAPLWLPQHARGAES